MPTRPSGGKHPEPRPGVDASKVLATSALTERGAAPAFDDARAIPQILDGIRCRFAWRSRQALRRKP